MVRSSWLHQSASKRPVTRAIARPRTYHHGMGLMGLIEGGINFGVKIPSYHSQVASWDLGPNLGNLVKKVLSLSCGGT